MQILINNQKDVQCFFKTVGLLEDGRGNRGFQLSDEEKGLRCNLQKVSHGVEEIVFYGYGNVTHGWGATCYGTGVLDFLADYNRAAQHLLQIDRRPFSRHDVFKKFRISI